MDRNNKFAIISTDALLTAVLLQHILYYCKADRTQYPFNIIYAALVIIIAIAIILSIRWDRYENLKKLTEKERKTYKGLEQAILAIYISVNSSSEEPMPSQWHLFFVLVSPLFQ